MQCLLASEPSMVPVKGGSYSMGDNSAAEVSPVRTVTLSNYQIGRFAVTQAQWAFVMGTKTVAEAADDMPVTNVSWNDIQQFISRLNAATGKQYRLPTEAEWEYAARGGASTKGHPYSGVAHNLSGVVRYIWFNGAGLQPVGKKEPNELGLYDMSGNVWEWVSDRYAPYTAAPQTNPTGATSGAQRTIRGGAFNSPLNECSVWFRKGETPESKRNNLGFRLAL